MISLEVFMSKVGVSRKKYVQKWIEQDLIPGVVLGADIESTLFPDAARRPYKERAKIKPTATADNLRAHIVKAALNKQHITYQMCHISADEFEGYVSELKRATLIRIRISNGITYYDSTLLSSQYASRKINEISAFVIDALEAMSKGVSEGITAAILDKAS